MRNQSLKKAVHIAVLGCLLSPAMGISATAEELEQRLKKLEEEIKASKEEIKTTNYEVVDTVDRFKNAMSIGGYADIEYVGTDKHKNNLSNDNKERSGFRMHHLSLMFKKQIREDLKFFSEIEYEDGVFIDDGDGKNLILVEAINFDYALSHSTTVRVGRFFTPAGIWSVDHYPPFVLTQDRPLHIRNIFPQLTDGASVTGTHPMGTGFVNYNIYVGNGETPNFNGKTDSNSNLAAGLRVNASLPITKVFDVGATFYHEKMNDGSGADPEEPKKDAYGVHARIKEGSFGFQGEYANGKYKPTVGADAGTSYHKKGYYGQFSYDIGKFTLGYRYDHYDPKSTVTLDKTKINSLIANYHVDKNTVLKWEHHLIDLEDTASKDYYRSIASVVVNFD